MRMAKYTNTPIDFFLNLPIDEFYDWVRSVNDEVKRENDALKKT